jgi:hypothetical protein
VEGDNDNRNLIGISLFARKADDQERVGSVESPAETSTEQEASFLGVVRMFPKACEFLSIHSRWAVLPDQVGSGVALTSHYNRAAWA